MTYTNIKKCVRSLCFTCKALSNRIIDFLAPLIFTSKDEFVIFKHLNAEFQRITRRNKKAFLSNQCKEIEESNRMGKTRDLFKKIRHTKETFIEPCKDGLDKGQKWYGPNISRRY